MNVSQSRHCPIGCSRAPFRETVIAGWRFGGFRRASPTRERVHARVCAYGDSSAVVDCGRRAKDRPCPIIVVCVRASRLPRRRSAALLTPLPVSRVKCGFRHIKLAIATMAQLRYTRNLFLRGICIIYLFAFLSFYVQIPGEAYPRISAP